nr:dystrotelin [Nothobranchius furzeri]
MIHKTHPSVYRATLKLLSLQKLCQMDVVLVRHITAAFHVGRGAKKPDIVVMDREEVSYLLNRIFHSVSQEVSGHVTEAGPEETCSLMFRLFERDQTGSVSAQSVKTALIALSADNLLQKYTGLINVLRKDSGSISRSGLKSMLKDLSQVPAAVQEEGVFGNVEEALSSCFNKVMAPSVSKEHMFSWLQSEPRLLLWIPTLYRLLVGQKVSHAVRCHVCKQFPIKGLRYRCKKCVNVHVCQSCYLSKRQTRKHRTHHPVVEFCNQPTWKESLSSLARNARHALLPWRYTQRDGEMRVLMWAEPGEVQNRAPPPSHASQLAQSTQSPSSDEVYHDVAVDALAPPLCSSKCLQTDKEMHSQQESVALLSQVKNLERDKWLLEQQLQAWRLTVQSEQDALVDRCSEMEVTMETLKQHNNRLQGMLTQALTNMEAQQHANNTPPSFNSERIEHETSSPQHANNTPPSFNSERIEHETSSPPHANNTPPSFNSEHIEHETSSPQHANNTPPSFNSERIEHETSSPQHANNTPPSFNSERIEHETSSPQHANNTPPSFNSERIERETSSPQHANNTPPSFNSERIERETSSPQHANNTPSSFNTEHTDRGNSRSSFDSLTNSEEELRVTGQQTPSPTIHQGWTLPHEDLHGETETLETYHHQPTRQQSRSKKEGLLTEDKCLFAEREDCGKCSPEQMLQEAVIKLKTEMENKRCTEGQRNETRTGTRWEAEILKAAEVVGDSIHHLVEGMRTIRPGDSCSE